MGPVEEYAVKILVAAVFGALLGAERESRDKSAGLRTITLIAMGAAIFTIVSIQIPGPHDTSRIAAQIVAGIGFLGAGAIIRSNGHVFGLTTASTIWLAAALGMGVGAGEYTMAAIGLGIGLVVLRTLPLVEGRITRHREFRRYAIVCENTPERVEHFAGLIQAAGLRAQARSQQKRADGRIVCFYGTFGRPADHEQLTRQLLADSDVIELTF